MIRALAPAAFLALLLSATIAPVAAAEAVPTARLSGEVRDDLGRPIPGANLSIVTKTEENYAVHDAQTAADGSFVANVEQGFVQVVVQKPNHQTTSTAFWLQHDLRLDLVMPRGEVLVVGSVHDAFGNPVADATVSLRRVASCAESICAHAEAYSEGNISYDPGDAKADAYTVKTDPEGRWRSNIGPGTVRIEVQASGTGLQSTVVRLDPGERVFATAKMPPMPDVLFSQGRAVAQNGSPLPGAAVRIQSRLPEWTGEWNAGSDGFFSVTMPGTTMLLQVSPPACDAECDDAFADRLFVLHRSSPALGDVRMEPRSPKSSEVAEVTGWLQDNATDAPLANGRILFVSTANHDHGWASTGNDGSYRIRLRQEPFLVYVTGANHGLSGGELDLRGTAGVRQSFRLDSLPGSPYWTIKTLGEDETGRTGTSARAPLQNQDLSQEFPFAVLGNQTFHGEAGGLGEPISDPGSGIPGAPAVFVVSALFVCVLVRRRR